MILQQYQVFILASLIFCGSSYAHKHPPNIFDPFYYYLDYGFNNFHHRRPNSRVPPVYDKYHDYYTLHKQKIPYPYHYPVTVLVNNHRPVAQRPTTVINNHFPLKESTRRPLPTNEFTTNNTLVFGLKPPQLHVTSSIVKDPNTGIVSSNAISFIDRPQDTTTLYSDLIVLKKPFGNNGIEPESLTVFVSQNGTKTSHVVNQLSTELITTESEFETVTHQNDTTDETVETTDAPEITTPLTQEVALEESTALSEVTAVSSSNPPHIHTSISIAETHNIVNRPPPPPQRQNLLSLLLQRPLMEGVLMVLPGALLALTVIILLSIV